MSYDFFPGFMLTFKGDPEMFLICLLIWILFNGRVTVEVLLFGIVISAALYALCCLLLGFSFQKDKEIIALIPGICVLLGILIIEIIKANLKVVRMVYRRQDTEPYFTEFDVSLKSAAARAVLADCITLTPGTITGILNGSHYTVHCLDRSMAEPLDSSAFVRQLQKIEDGRSSKS